MWEPAWLRSNEDPREHSSALVTDRSGSVHGGSAGHQANTQVFTGRSATEKMATPGVPVRNKLATLNRN